MSFMFYNCSFLTSIDTSDFNTIKVTHMNFMFSKSVSLKSIDISKFNIQSLTNFEQMFSNCYSLKSAILFSFNTQNAFYPHMFYNYSSLEFLDISKFVLTENYEIFYVFNSSGTIVMNKDSEGKLKFIPFKYISYT